MQFPAHDSPHHDPIFRQFFTSTVYELCCHRSCCYPIHSHHNLSKPENRPVMGPTQWKCFAAHWIIYTRAFGIQPPWFPSWSVTGLLNSIHECLTSTPVLKKFTPSWASRDKVVGVTTAVLGCHVAAMGFRPSPWAGQISAYPDVRPRVLTWGIRRSSEDVQGRNNHRPRGWLGRPRMMDDFQTWWFARNWLGGRGAAVDYLIIDMQHLLCSRRHWRWFFTLYHPRWVG